MLSWEDAGTSALSAAVIADTLEGIDPIVLGPQLAVRDASVWGAVAQLGERLVRNEEVSGSIPLSSTKESIT